MTPRHVRLRLADGSEIRATVECSDRGPACRLRLIADGIDEVATGTNYFASFAEIRRRLAVRRILPRCYGASRNVWPSGMACDMAQGLAAYRLTLGAGARQEDLVGIFDDGPDVDPATPEEQRAFSEAWFRSLGRAAGDGGSGSRGLWRRLGRWLRMVICAIPFLGNFLSPLQDHAMRHRGQGEDCRPGVPVLLQVPDR